MYHHETGYPTDPSSETDPDNDRDPLNHDPYNNDDDGLGGKDMSFSSSSEQALNEVIMEATGIAPPKRSKSTTTNTATNATGSLRFKPQEERRNNRRAAEHGEEKHVYKHGAQGAPKVGGIGMKLLMKMGYEPGKGLGAQGEGRVDPIAVQMKKDRAGLGGGFAARQAEAKQARGASKAGPAPHAPFKEPQKAPQGPATAAPRNNEPPPPASLFANRQHYNFDLRSSNPELRSNASNDGAIRREPYFVDMTGGHKFRPPRPTDEDGLVDGKAAPGPIAEAIKLIKQIVSCLDEKIYDYDVQIANETARQSKIRADRRELEMLAKEKELLHAQYQVLEGKSDRFDLLDQDMQLNVLVPRLEACRTMLECNLDPRLIERCKCRDVFLRHFWIPRVRQEMLSEREGGPPGRRRRAQGGGPGKVGPLSHVLASLPVKPVAQGPLRGCHQGEDQGEAGPDPPLPPPDPPPERH